MELGLAGKSVLITGASRGIGYAAARGFATEGCNLHLVARDAELLGTIKQKLSTEHDICVETLALDMRAPHAIDRIAERFGASEILVNNAGDIPHGSLDEIGEDLWRTAWDLKVFGYIDLTRMMYAEMRKRRAGVIVNVIGIVGGERVMSEYIAGTAGNAALASFTRALGSTSPNDGIRVVGVHPGLILTDRQLVRWQKRAAEKFNDADRWIELTTGYPFGRLGDASEVANAIVFLASSAASYISASSLTIDGGFSQKLVGPYRND